MKLTEEQKIELLRLRMSDGLSVKEIARYMNLGVGTVSKYCSGLRDNNPCYTNQQAATLAFQRNSSLKRGNIILEARTRWIQIKSDPILISLISLYWAEGSKRTKHKTSAFVLTNSDPGIILVAIKALHSIGYYNLYGDIRILPEQELETCRTAWERLLGIEIRSVRQYKRRSDSTKIWSKYGVCKLCVTKSSGLWLSVMTWIECWRSELESDDSCQL